MLDRFLESLKQSDIGRKLLLGEAERARAERQTRVSEYTQIDVDTRAAIEQRRPARDKALAVREKARIAFDAAQAHFRTLEHEILSLKVQAQTRRARLESQLVATAPASIDTALRQLADQLAAVQHDGFQSDEVVDRTAVPAQRVVRTNASAIEAVSTAARTARAQLVALKLTAVDDLDGAIAKILSRVPWESIKTLQPIRRTAA